MVAATLVRHADCNGYSSGFPNIEASQGTIWPQPQVILAGNGGAFLLDPNHFQFKVDQYTRSCDIIQASMKRHIKRYFTNGLNTDTNYENKIHSRGSDIRGSITEVELVMNNYRGCSGLNKNPVEFMDEHYEIKIDSPDEPNRARIIAFSVWGILRGMESFGHLIYYKADQSNSNVGVYLVNSTQVMDFPRFTHRGVMLDSSRHFLSKSVIIANLDLMEMNKMNVFHWHLTDDQSFPYESKTFPQLSKKGSYNPNTHVYHQQDIKEILEAARIRGIRVVPEFDTPGHTRSWENGHPGLLTKCFDGVLGPVNPILNSTYAFMKRFFHEVMTVFPDELLHLGGDEVNTNCWENNTEIVTFMQENNITDAKLLEAYYLAKIFEIVESYKPSKKSYAVWQEAFQNGQGQLSKNAIVHVWKKEDWQNVTQKATGDGMRVLLSAPWYLNYISYGIDWHNYYKIDPQNFGGDDKQRRLVLGGEACMWGEFVNSINLIPRLWPRASAVAERLWSSAEVTDVNKAAPRLQEHECRMLKRGYRVEPSNGPGYCDIDWN